MEGDKGYGDEDPDKWGAASFPSDSRIQLFLVDMQVSTNAEDFLAPIKTHTSPPSSARWRKSDTVGIQTQHVYKVGGQDAPMVSSHSKIQQFLISEKVPVTQDDDILAPIPYTSPPMWRKSETKIVGIEQVYGTEVGGCGLDVVGVRREDTRGEGIGNRLEQFSMHQR